jgi:type II secretory pathway pseudopilin PulG
MNRGADSQKSKAGGFTIIETLIFLAVSGLMLVMALMFISGKQARQQFQSSVRDFESRLTDIANDVSSGYYQNGEEIACLVNSSGEPYFPSAQPTKPLGSNTPCIFVGTVVKLANGDSSSGREQMIQYTMAGTRTAGGKDVTTLDQANPRVINRGDNYSIKSIGGGISVQCVGVGSSCSSTSTDNTAIGFFTTFQGSDPSEDSRALQTDVVSYGNKISLADALGTTRLVLNETDSSIDYQTLEHNPQLTICLLSGGSKQYALVRIGGNSSSSQTITSEIKSFSGATPPCS